MPGKELTALEKALGAVASSKRPKREALGRAQRGAAERRS